ncbi:hypothetical protein BDM02DRAFT_3156273 [Thelephora ganbajun]|uniref:Uncharacterized protein n=1 Tax=Thelephora ganbajun TaxID=370292 RepID=A0ACB6ZC81_THEGA|nr:hypothetical protein BDM02DRAFT_3156273 [Thelephora ganbajun]
MPRQAGILGNASGVVGYAPLIRLNKIVEGTGSKLGKIEHRSSGGSVKDRIAKRMAEGATIKPTSANAVREYSVIIAMPEKTSLVSRTTLAAWDSPESFIVSECALLLTVVPTIFVSSSLQVNDPLTREYTNGPEIIEDLIAMLQTLPHPSFGKVGVFTAGAGTDNPNRIVVRIDPKGRVLAYLGTLSDKADKGVPYTSDTGAFATVKLRVKNEGLLWLKMEAAKKTADTEGLNALPPRWVRFGTIIGKEWFLSIGLKGEPSPLSHQIKDIPRIKGRSSQYPIVESLKENGSSDRAWLLL